MYYCPDFTHLFVDKESLGGNRSIEALFYQHCNKGRKNSQLVSFGFECSQLNVSVLKLLSWISLHDNFAKGSIRQLCIVVLSYSARGLTEWECCVQVLSYVFLATNKSNWMPFKYLHRMEINLLHWYEWMLCKRRNSLMVKEHFGRYGLKLTDQLENIINLYVKKHQRWVCTTVL